MPEAKPTEKPETKPEAKAEGPSSITTHVWAPAGGVAKNSVISAAINSVRDAIPVVFELDAVITGAKKKQQDGQDGTEFEVTVNYTPRELAGKDVDAVDPAAVIKGLEVPTSVDGIHGVEGDPEFLSRKDSSEFPTK